MTRLFVFIALLLLFSGCASQETITKATNTSTTAQATTTTEITTTTISTSTTTTTTTTTTSSTTTTSFPPLDFSGSDKLKLSTSLNKKTYRSSEQMRIDLKINSPKPVDAVVVHVYGIFAGTHFWLNKTTTTSLSPGVNNVTFNYTTPLCNICSGIAAGTYVVQVEILYQDKAVARDIKSVSIIQ